MKEIILPPGTTFIVQGIKKQNSKICFILKVKTKED